MRHLFVRRGGWSQTLNVDYPPPPTWVLADESGPPTFLHPPPCRMHTDCQESVEIGRECSRSRMAPGAFPPEIKRLVFHRFQFRIDGPEGTVFVYLEDGVTMGEFIDQLGHRLLP